MFLYSPHNFGWRRPKPGIWSVIIPVLCMGFFSCSPASKTGTLTGSIRLDGEIDHEGIEVFIPGSTFRAITDAEGRYRIDALPPGTYEVVASVDGFEEWRESITINPGEITALDSTILLALAPPLGSIAGTIALADSDDHSGIVVLLVGASESTFTNADGEFRFADLEPGNYNLAAFKEGYGSIQQENIEVNIGEETELEDLTLSPILDDATPTETETLLIGNARIRGLCLLSGQVDHSGTTVQIAGQPKSATETQSNGMFVLSSLPEDSYNLVFTHEGYVEGHLDDVKSTVQSIAPMVTITLDPIPERIGLGTIRGKILLDGAASHEGTEVRLAGIQQSVQTVLDGTFTFIGVPTGNYILIAEHAGYAPGRTFVRVDSNGIASNPEITLTPSSDQPLFEGNCVVEGRVLLENTNDHAGTIVHIPGTSVMAMSDSDGFYILNNVPAGPQEFRFEKASYEPYIYAVELQPNADIVLEDVFLATNIERPYVLETLPRDGAKRIPIHQEVVDVLVTFSAPMSGVRVKSSVEISPPVTFRAYFDRETKLSNINRLHLQLMQMGKHPVQFEEEYTITIHETAASLEQVEMAEPFTFSFETDGPLITASYPQDGEEILKGIGDQLWFETNARVDPRTVSKALRFRPKADSKPEVYINPRGAGDRVSLDLSLNDSTRYQITIGRELRTLDGKRFANTPYTVKFETGDPVGEDFGPEGNVLLNDRALRRERRRR